MSESAAHESAAHPMLNGMPFPGYYRHHSGGFYEVIHPIDNNGISPFGRFVQGGPGTEEQVGEPVIVYHRIGPSETYGTNAVWVRPLSDFLGSVIVDGAEVPRFQAVELEEVPEELYRYMNI